jgi:flavin reductase (DIM6/NTAB) family NADH-FMN oxidoreductase RutF
MCYISIRKERHSYNIIKKNKEFVINLTTKNLVYATDWCGVKSGKDYDKFKEMKLTKEKASIVKSPMIYESPVNIECKVKDIIPLGTHDMFIAEIVAVNIDENFLDKTTDAFNLRQTEPIAYLHGNYYVLGEKLGRFGFSVRKKSKKNKTRKKK